MMVLITYDVSTESDGGKRRLRRVAKACRDFGQRVQFSVFECTVDPAQWVRLRDRLIKEIDPKQDSLRFYQLGANWKGRLEHVGAKPVLDLDGPFADVARTASVRRFAGSFAGVFSFDVQCVE